MLDKAPNKKLSDLLDTFGAALSAGDIDKAVDCFQDDCYWRDLVTFTWNLKTMEGKDQVRAMLDEIRRRAFRSREPEEPGTGGSPRARTRAATMRCWRAGSASRRKWREVSAISA